MLLDPLPASCLHPYCRCSCWRSSKARWGWRRCRRRLTRCEGRHRPAETAAVMRHPARRRDAKHLHAPPSPPPCHPPIPTYMQHQGFPAHLFHRGPAAHAAHQSRAWGLLSGAGLAPQPCTRAGCRLSSPSASGLSLPGPRPPCHPTAGVRSVAPCAERIWSRGARHADAGTAGGGGLPWRPAAAGAAVGGGWQVGDLAASATPSRLRSALGCSLQ